MTPPPPRGHTHRICLPDYDQVDPEGNVPTSRISLWCADPENCPQTRAVELLEELWKVYEQRDLFNEHLSYETIGWLGDMFSSFEKGRKFLASLESNSSAAGKGAGYGGTAVGAAASKPTPAPNAAEENPR